jgi:hypothetical protein
MSDKPLPILDLLVSGGRLSEPSVKRIETFVENHRRKLRIKYDDDANKDKR